VEGALIYCADYRCSHSITMPADRWPDDVRLSDIEPRFICKTCGKRGADVRPNFENGSLSGAIARASVGEGKRGRQLRRPYRVTPKANNTRLQISYASNSPVLAMSMTCFAMTSRTIVGWPESWSALHAMSYASPMMRTTSGLNGWPSMKGMIVADMLGFCQAFRLPGSSSVMENKCKTPLAVRLRQ
jgi:hypothetical protein